MPIIKYAFILLSFILFGFGIPKIFPSKIDRANTLYYQALKLADKGKPQKAIKKLKRAIQLNRKNEYIIDLASLQAKSGNVKKAYRTIGKIVPLDTDSPVQKVEMKAWRAYYALSLGLSLEPFPQFNSAIETMDLYRVDSVSLMSDLYNNSGVSKLFHQTEVKKNQKPLIHINDFKEAKKKLMKALEYNPDNCVAKYNLEIIEKALSIPKDSLIAKGAVRNVSQHLWEVMNFPELDCELPKPPPHQEILVKLNKEKEVVFILDISGSMRYPANDGRSRFEVMKELALELINDLDPVIEIGLITLGKDCDTHPRYNIPVGTKSREELKAMVASLNLDGSTPLNDRLQKASHLFTKQKREKCIFLCSDGINSCNKSESTCRIGDELRSKKIKVYAFSLLLENDDSMREYAIYDCITKATYGELLGITETEEYETKTQYISERVYPLALKKEDLVTGIFTPLVPSENVLRYNPNEDSK